ncbi:FAD binding domain-containing protein [Actinophytocola sp.]|jgi:xanthine dehydrogenase YagS FAD-binding subunit|uniref:FAD binding domain-containing protein n=1 Tax=Actinophytocola sp. TaxID=1872138 RepID=UPI002EDA4D73
MTIRPTDLATAVALRGPYRAGGVDVAGRAGGGWVDLGALTALRGIEADGSGLTIGATTTLRELERSSLVRATHPMLATAAAAVANPNVRALATVGGNLLQGPRCVYFAHPDIACLRKGGTDCPARQGFQEGVVCFDTTPCVAPHPSTLATVLACLGAVAHVEGRGPVAVAELVAHRPRDGELLTTVTVPPPWSAERSHYLRVTARGQADWPLVEVAARAHGDEVVQSLRLTAGAVAATPLRLTAVERYLVGRPPTPDGLRAAARLAAADANPLAGSAHKVGILRAAVLDALNGCWHPSGTPTLPA